jgi:bacillithiol biosynthesis deacetylase BshB1
MLERVDVLAIGAHPDDIELGCGGTIGRLVDQGKTVAAVDLTRGELGTRGDPETRAQEAEAAAAILSLRFRVNLAMEDGIVASNPESRLALIRVIRECRPRLVLTHSATGHPDHWGAATLVREAVHHSGLVRINTQQERHRPDRIAYWLEYTQAQVPQAVVNISEYFELKMRALKAHRSQLFDQESQDLKTYLSEPDFLEQIRSHHRHLGNLAGCRLAEGFLLSRTPRIQDLTKF